MVVKIDDFVNEYGAKENEAKHIIDRKLKANKEKIGRDIFTEGICSLYMGEFPVDVKSFRKELEIKYQNENPGYRIRILDTGKTKRYTFEIKKLTNKK